MSVNIVVEHVRYFCRSVWSWVKRDIVERRYLLRRTVREMYVHRVLEIQEVVVKSKVGRENRDVRRMKCEVAQARQRKEE